MLLVKFSADDILKYFSDFSQKTEFDISSGDNLHEMSNPVFFGGKNKKNISIGDNLHEIIKSCLLLNKLYSRQ